MMLYVYDEGNVRNLSIAVDDAMRSLGGRYTVGPKSCARGCHEIYCINYIMMKWILSN